MASFDFYAAQESSNAEAIRFPYTAEQFRAEFEDWIALQNKMVTNLECQVRSCALGEALNLTEN